MFVFPLRFRTALSAKLNSLISTPLHLEKLVLLVAASLWIPWTLACGASAQSSPAAGSTTPANRTALELASQLPSATSQKPYAVALAPKGGTAPYKFSITQGALPLEVVEVALDVDPDDEAPDLGLAVRPD